MVGPLVRSSVRQYYVDKIFLGTDGFVKNVGFMGSDVLRTEAVKNMAESARNIIIITDSSKFSKRGLLVQFSQKDPARIITDKKLPEDYQEFFKAIGVPLTLVD